VARDVPVTEPGFFYLPFQRGPARLGLDETPPDPSGSAITHITIGSPIQARSAAAQVVQAAGWFAIQSSPRHIMRLQLGGPSPGQVTDLQPELPLVLEWQTGGRSTAGSREASGRTTR